jgi:hypothetical protein
VLLARYRLPALPVCVGVCVCVCVYGLCPCVYVCLWGCAICLVVFDIKMKKDGEQGGIENFLAPHPSSDPPSLRLCA